MHTLNLRAGKAPPRLAGRLIYPAHDYNDWRVSLIAQEKLRNPQRGKGRMQEDFSQIAISAAQVRASRRP